MSPTGAVDRSGAGSGTDRSPEVDVIVVGAGFAGVVAAREVDALGLSSMILEARGRIGGRTWLRADAIRGRALEMGGTWIDPRQTESWGEAQRYGAVVGEPVRGAPPTAWLIEGRSQLGPFPVPAEQLGQLERLVRRLGTDADRIDPGVALAGQQVSDLDVPLNEYISMFGVPHDVASAGSIYLSMYGSAPPHDVSALHILRRISAAGSLAEFVMSGASHPLVGGTGALLAAILSDAHVPVRLGTPVSRIVQTDTQVTVVTQHTELTSRAAILTIPVNTWKDIVFDPPLSREKQRLSEEELACRGFKVWLLAEGIPVGFSACGDAGPFGMLWTEDTFDDGASLLVAYGNEAAAIDITDRDQLNEALRAYVPEARVLDSAGHDWRRDRWSQETWAVFRPGQLTAYEAAMRSPEGRIAFGGSATALRWPGFIDGAIESGKRAAHEAARLVSQGFITAEP